MKHTAPRIAAALALLAAVAAHGGDMYKWQDEDGIWHYSDRPPAAGQAFDTFTVTNEPKRMVSMRRSGPRHKPAYHFFNHYHGPAELELWVNEADNVKAEPPLPARVVLPGQVESRVVTFAAVDPRAAYQYRLAYSLVPGPPVENLPADVDFYPPFPEGMSFPVSQGLDDDTTHTTPDNRYAVDITMPTGTPVLAARGGLVMEMEDDFHGEGKQEKRYMNRANFVRILHDDGSMAVYAHLQPNSVRVYPGNRVPAGTWIANSGNTGFSSGPHLHFVIQLNVGMALESLPFSFRRKNAPPVTPDRRMMLAGVLPKP
jgi:murein DD-endopeptidase MepM/ murein hydrolase activator NlpD